MSPATPSNAPAASSGGSPPTFLRLSIGLVYFYFGFLKFFPDLSPAEVLAGETLTRMSGHMISASTAIWLLAWMEVVIGFCFLFDGGFRLYRLGRLYGFSFSIGLWLDRFRCALALRLDWRGGVGCS